MSSSDKFDPCNCGTVRIIKATDKAFLVESDNFDDKIWVPRSQLFPNYSPDDNCIHKNSVEGDEGELVLPMWLAREKGLTF